MIFHAGPTEHFAKLHRIVARLIKQEVHADDLDDFCKTAWHLVELVEHDRTAPRQTRKRVSRLRSDPDIAVCQFAATMEKHGEVGDKVQERAKLSGVSIEQGWGAGRYGMGDYGVGEQSITLRFNDGTERDALAFVTTVLAKWTEALSDWSMDGDR
jgi:hypothetical protein